MKLNTLKTIGKHPRWCGPSALSILTGRSINHCASLIAKERNRRGYWRNGKGTSKQVKGTYTSEMSRALHSMKFSMNRIRLPRGKTLRAYMAGRGGKEWKANMLLEVTNHYVAVNRDMVSDNHSQDDHYNDHPMKRKIVRDGWLIERIR